MKNELQPENLEDISYDHVERIIESRRRRADEAAFRRHQKRIVRSAVVFGILTVIVCYFLLPVSRISSIRVEGNRYLSADYIRQVSQLTEDDRFYLTVPFLIEKRLEADPLIESADVSMMPDQTVRISVTEKKMIGYRYVTQPEVVLSDGSTAALKSEYLDLIAKIPLISGFEDEGELKKLASAFADVDQEVIEDMAEISEYSLSYDPSAIRVLMRTGGYFIGSYYSMENINSYNAVYALMSDHSKCLFSLEGQSKVAQQVCPWNEEGKEYWTDASGNYILNSSGEKAVRHYYTDANGNAALDANGQKIVIPIDENGDEVKDGDFQSHYAAGYYASGSLVLPEDDEAGQ